MLVKFQMMFFKKFASLWVHLICLSFSINFRPPLDVSMLQGIKQGTGDPDGNAITRFGVTVSPICVHFMFIVLFNSATASNWPPSSAPSSTSSSSRGRR